MRDAKTLQWTYLTPAFEAIYGLSREEALKGDNYRNWLDLIVPADRERADQCISTVSKGKTATFEYRIRRPSDGAIRWLRNTDFPIQDAGGRVTHVGGIGSNITDHKRAETEIRENAEKLRLIVEGARDYAIFTLDRDKVIQTWLPGAENVFGWSKEEAEGRLVDITFTPEARAADQPREEVETAAREGQAPDVRWHQRKDGRHVFIDGRTIALRDTSGEIDGFLKIGQDVTETHRASERQKTLLAELQHRVRNILAMIRSVARRTAETTETVEDYVEHLQGRISAMARTQALLTRDAGAAVDLQNLLLDELETQAAQPEQYRLTGPDIALPPKAAEVLGLALHELATNSVKYGALSGTTGRLDVRWALLEGNEAPQLSLTWSETGMDVPKGARREGFGTELITHRVPYELNGTGTMEFTREALVATIEFPLTNAASILQTDEGSRR